MYVRKNSEACQFTETIVLPLMTRLRTYWFPLLEGKSVGEITRDDIYQIFTDESVSKLAPKTINSIVSAITIPMK